jgi:anti-sigma regulatory factor (Ser/Thr protein kinase)
MSKRAESFSSESRVSLPIDATTFAAARQHVRRMLAGQPSILIDDAVQVTDELVSNAYRHGDPPRHVRLALIDDRRRLRIEVDDASPKEPMLRSRDRTGGLGIMLVDRLASGWGIERHEHRKTVWAELDLVRPAIPGRTPNLSVVPR